MEETLIQNASHCEEDDRTECRKDSLGSSASRQQQQDLQERKQSLKQWDSSGPTQEETNQWSHEETYENYVQLYKYCEVNKCHVICERGVFMCMCIDLGGREEI